MARLLAASRVVLSCALLGCAADGDQSAIDAGRSDAAPDAALDAQPVADGAVAPAPVGCDVTAPTTCPDPAPRYADVAPIFAQYCTGCHNGREGMWPLSSYQHVADWYGEIRGQLLACTMPPMASGIVLPRAERERILSWIRCGFPR